jgi:hypothetical protein
MWSATSPGVQNSAEKYKGLEGELYGCIPTIFLLDLPGDKIKVPVGSSRSRNEKWIDS